MEYEKNRESFSVYQEVTNLIEALTPKAGEGYTQQQIEDLLFSSSVQCLHQVIDSVYAIDIAMALEQFDQNALMEFYKKIDHAHMAKILEQAEESLQSAIVTMLAVPDVLSLFHFMSNDDIADILGELHISVQKEILKSIRSEDKETLQKLLLYPDDTVGSIMTTEYIALKETLTAAETLQAIKKIGPETEVIETIFVVNHKNQLAGTADLRDIFVAEDDQILQRIMDDNFVTVAPEDDQEQASSLVSKYDLKALAVVNRRGSMLGIVTVDDIIDVLEEEHTEDMLKFGGVSGEEDPFTSGRTSVKIRLPWLFVNLITAFLAAFVVSKFEGVIGQVVALSAMMPIVAGMSGNAGSQTLAIIIRGITLGEINLKDDWKIVFKELRVGMFNGLATGLITAVVIFLMYGNIALSLIVIAAMILNAIVSSTFGFFIPLILKALKFDPALASNIFLTTATDTMAFLILLGLASLCLPYIL